MLEAVFNEIYMKFKLNFYKSVFRRVGERKLSLSATEVFSVEVIYALGRPTIREFADFIHISQPNATYKVNSLVKKGYVNKVNSESDKREYHLEVTAKFRDYYQVNDTYIKEVMGRIRKRFTEEEARQFERMLTIMSKELM